MPLLAMLAFLGGLSAATSMIMFETVTLSTMVCNDLVMPILLRANPRWLAGRSDLSGLLIGIRRAGIIILILLGYLYFRFVGESYALVASGLVSFAAAAQFAPPILIGLFWKRANRRGALIGLSCGFAVWAYTLFLPAMARSGWISAGFVELGPFGLELLKPYALFGLEGLDPYMHSVFWSMLVNIGGLVYGSLLGRPDPSSRYRAASSSMSSNGSAMTAIRCSGGASWKQRICTICWPASSARSAPAKPSTATPRSRWVSAASRFPADSLHRTIAGRRDWRGVGASDDLLNCDGRSAEHRGGDDHPRREHPGIEYSRRLEQNPANWNLPRPNCAKPTIGCRNWIG
jgi:hypothetical protein